MHKNKLKIKFCILIFAAFILAFSTSYASNIYEQFVGTETAIEVMEDGNIITSFKEENTTISTYGVSNSFLFSNLKASKLPEKYCLKDDIKVNVYKQTGDTCWIYSTNTILETTVAKETKTEVDYDKFSVQATEEDSAKIYNREVNKGGNPGLALSFYTSGYGPKTTKTNDIDTKIGDYILLSSIIKGKDSKGNLQYNGGAYTEEQVELIRNNIKKHIKEYGAVTSCMYSKEKEYFSDETNYLNSEAYFCDYNYLFGQTNRINPDHQITIIGWDDNYSKENFNSKHRPKNDGAYIALNSWGEEFSKDGIFYISYEDTFVENSVYGVYNVEEKDYDNLYQHDELGLRYIMAFEKEVNYGANVFTRTTSEKEILTEVSVANLVDSAYEIYVNKVDGDLDFNKFEKVAETDVLDAGYHTIELEREVILSGEKFVIAVKYKNDKNGLTYFGVEYTDEKECEKLGQTSAWKNAKINEGESYVYGEKIGYWGDIKGIFSGDKISEEYKQIRNLCIKGFTEKYESKDVSGEFEISSKEYKINNEEPKFENISNNKQIVMCCLLITICIRGYLGLILNFEWKSSFAIGLVCVTAVVLGKILGGILGDKFGWRKISTLSLIISAILFIFAFDNSICGILAILLFNMTMPITLTALSNMFNNNKGMAFGLTTLALFIGAIPVLFGYTNFLFNNIALFITTVLSSLILYAGLKKYETLES